MFSISNPSGQPQVSDLSLFLILKKKKKKRGIFRLERGSEIGTGGRERLVSVITVTTGEDILNCPFENDITLQL